MGRDFVQILQSELTTDIFSRLPLRSIAISKCVCKSWLDLLDSDDFELKIPPAPALVCLNTCTEKTNPTRCTIFELEDKDEADLESHDLHYIPLTGFDIPHGSKPMECTAANGLLLLYPSPHDHETPVYICNPLTRKYIVLSRPEGPEAHTSLKYWFTFNFCVSKTSGQYKVVCIGRAYTFHTFQVYTLGTGTWRHVETGAASGFRYSYNEQVECNSNLHWTLSSPVKPYFRICGFHIETECFSIFSPPPALPTYRIAKFTVLKDCLCFCYTWGYEIVMWLMKEYQVEKSWTIEYKLSTIGFDMDRAWVYPIKVFKDGDILMLLKMWQHWLIYYSNKTKTTQQVGMFNYPDAWCYPTFAMIFTPSLLSLKSFGFENVKSF